MNTAKNPSGSIRVEVTDYLCDNQLFIKGSIPYSLWIK